MPCYALVWRLAMLLRRSKSNNSNVGAQYIVKNSEQYLVRSVGLARDIKDLANIVLKVRDGTAVHVRDVATIGIGGEVRQGLATRDGRGETVVGLVLKLIGTNTSKVVADVKAQLIKINKLLPNGVHIIAYYDQSKLVNRSVATVTDALLQGIVLVGVIILVFMGGFRPSIVVALSIPFSIAFAFILMSLFGMSANLMSLGGIAIAIGMMVDGAIVIVENIDRLLKERHPSVSKFEIVARATTQMARPISFAILIIIVVFFPLFTLQGVEGKTFRPLAYTVSLAMLGSLIYAIIIAPVLASMVMRKPSKNLSARHKTSPKIASFSDRLIAAILRLYRPILHLFVKARYLAVTLSAALLAIGIVLFPLLGSEFVPRLNEGDLLVRVTMAPSISLGASRDMVLRFEKRLLERFSRSGAGRQSGRARRGWRSCRSRQ